MKSVFYALILLILPLSTQAATYEIDHEQSTVSFSGTHAGNVFKGVFEKWSADIKFDPADLENSEISATFALASAKTGNKMYDGTLPQADWFEVKNHPTGTFISETFEAGQDGAYTVHGNLTLRNKTHPLSFEFILSDLKSSPVTMTASFSIDRLAYDIGKKSDANAEWISQEIMMHLNLIASEAVVEK